VNSTKRRDLDDSEKEKLIAEVEQTLLKSLPAVLSWELDNFEIVGQTADESTAAIPEAVAELVFGPAQELLEESGGFSKDEVENQLRDIANQLQIFRETHYMAVRALPGTDVISVTGASVKDPDQYSIGIIPHEEYGEAIRIYGIEEHEYAIDSGSNNFQRRFGHLLR